MSLELEVVTMLCLAAHSRVIGERVADHLDHWVLIHIRPFPTTDVRRPTNGWLPLTTCLVNLLMMMRLATAQRYYSTVLAEWLMINTVMLMTIATTGSHPVVTIRLKFEVVDTFAFRKPTDPLATISLMTD